MLLKAMAALATVTVLASTAGCVSAQITETRMQQCIAGLAATLPDNVAGTLRRIPNADRRLLALRSYLRNSVTLASQWSWSDSQIASYERSAEHYAAKNELAKITARFEMLNPGYTLYVNTQVRSLDAQIDLWNENASVGDAARALQDAVGRRLERGSCAQADRADEALGEFLEDWRPPRTPSLAAPGLSRHGQGRAFDFQIKRGDRIVAGADTATSMKNWDRKGWTRKLHFAVNSASGKFSGPLRMPDEPWHYEYSP
jgi:hypothetical protein